MEEGNGETSNESFPKQEDGKEEEWNSAFEVLADYNKENDAHLSTRISWEKSNPSRKVYRIIGPKEKWAAVGYDRKNRVVAVSLGADLIADDKEMPESKNFFTPEDQCVFAVYWKGYKDLPFENVTRTNIAPYVFTDVVKETGKIVGVYIVDAREAFGLIPPSFSLAVSDDGATIRKVSEQPQQEQTADPSTLQ